MKHKGTWFVESGIQSSPQTDTNLSRGSDQQPTPCLVRPTQIAQRVDGCYDAVEITTEADTCPSMLIIRSSALRKTDFRTPFNGHLTRPQCHLRLRRMKEIRMQRLQRDQLRACHPKENMKQATGSNLGKRLAEITKSKTGIHDIPPRSLA